MRLELPKRGRPLGGRSFEYFELGGADGFISAARGELYETNGPVAAGAFAFGVDLARFADAHAGAVNGARRPHGVIALAVFRTEDEELVVVVALKIRGVDAHGAAEIPLDGRRRRAEHGREIRFPVVAVFGDVAVGQHRSVRHRVGSERRAAVKQIAFYLRPLTRTGEKRDADEKKQKRAEGAAKSPRRTKTL